MAKSFFSYREQVIPSGKIALDYHFRNAFGNLFSLAGNSYALSVGNGNLFGDGRLIGWVECADQATTDMVLGSFLNEPEDADWVAAKINLWQNRKGADLIISDGVEITDPRKEEA